MARRRKTLSAEDRLRIGLKRQAMRKKAALRAVSAVWLALLLVGTVVSGTNAENAVTVGWVRILMGCANLGVSGFILYTEIKGWYRFYVRYHRCDVLPVGKGDAKGDRRDLQEHRFVVILLGAVMLVFTAWLFVSGIQLLIGGP